MCTAVCIIWRNADRSKAATPAPSCPLQRLGTDFGQGAGFFPEGQGDEGDEGNGSNEGKDAEYTVEDTEKELEGGADKGEDAGPSFWSNSAMVTHSVPHYPFPLFHCLCRWRR